jgi:DNA-directed RNA polymerase specialized sigma24 family protein
MPQTLKLEDKRDLRPAETALALGMVSRIELLRLKTIARVYARGLPPDVGWDDLLQEALTRIILGARQQPEGVTMVAFVAGIMRSLRAGHWRSLNPANSDGRAIGIRYEVASPSLSGGSIVGPRKVHWIHLS